MGLIRPDIIERIVETTDIVQLVGSHVDLKRTGAKYKGRCPFHKEKTPSFFVTPEFGRYKCFGCDVSGNVIDFVMAMDGVGFPEAVEMLGDRAGIPVERDGEDRAPGEPTKNDLMKVNAWASEFFRRKLASEGGSSCRDYIQSRGITVDMAEETGLGWAPASWELLVGAAGKKNISEKLLLAAGLVNSRESGGIYDAFRDRLMFPIRDAMGRTIAFGARSLDGKEPKYLNSPETPVFSKRRALYGIDGLQGQDRETEVLVMEGYTDVIMARQHGCVSAVATLGTALTDSHARVLSLKTDRVTLVYDGDAAGRKAAERGADVFAAADIDLKISRLKGGYDPCDWILEQGEAGLESIRNDAEDFLEFVMSEVRGRHDVSTIHGKARAADELLRLVQQIANEVKQGEVLKKISENLDIERDDLVHRLRNSQKTRVSTRVSIQEETGTEETDSVKVTPAQREAEEDVLRALLRLPGLKPEVVGCLDESDFLRPVARRLAARMIFDDPDGDLVAGELLNSISDEEVRRMMNALMDDKRDPDAVLRDKRDPDAVLQDKFEGALKYFERSRDERRRRQLRDEKLSDDDLLRGIAETAPGRPQSDNSSKPSQGNDIEELEAF